MERLHLAASGMLALLALGSPVSADGRHPGSVLVFPIHRSGPIFVTVVSVTNVNDLPMTPTALGGATRVHYEYVNTVYDPAQPTVPAACSVFDRFELLTPADTLSTLTSCHDAVVGGQQGFLVVSAHDPAQFDVPWDFDWLVGSEYVVNAAGGMYSVEAVPLRGLPGAGLPTDLDADGQLDFDGLEYEGLPDVLFVDSFMAMACSRLTLVNLTGGCAARNLLRFEIFNDAGYPLSTTLVMGRWFDLPLYDLSPLFHADFLANATPDDPTELDLHCRNKGNVEMGWVAIDSLGVFLPGGALLADDGALLGVITSGITLWSDGGHLLGESDALQFNGVMLDP